MGENVLFWKIDIQGFLKQRLSLFTFFSIRFSHTLHVHQAPLPHFVKGLMQNDYVWDWIIIYILSLGSRL